MTAGLHTAIAELAEVFGDGMFAMQNGEHFTCSEAEAVAAVLVADGHDEAAETWIAGHAEGDGPGDSHYTPDTHIAGCPLAGQVRDADATCIGCATA